MIASCTKRASPKFWPEVYLTKTENFDDKKNPLTKYENVLLTYTKGLRTALHPEHFTGSYDKYPGIFSIFFKGV